MYTYIYISTLAKTFGQRANILRNEKKKEGSLLIHLHNIQEAIYFYCCHYLEEIPEQTKKLEDRQQLPQNKSHYLSGVYQLFHEF